MNISACFRPIIVVAAAFAVSSNAWPGQPAFRQLSAAEIRARVVGMAVTDDAHWSDHFHPGGVLRAYDLGQLRKGTWKLEGDELCMTRAGTKPTTDCFEIWASGDGIQYRRDGVVIAEAHLRPIPSGERP